MAFFIFLKTLFSDLYHMFYAVVQKLIKGLWREVKYQI